MSRPRPLKPTRRTPPPPAKPSPNQSPPELADLHVGPERDTAIWACLQWIEEATEQMGRALGETAWAPRGGWPALRGSIGKAEGGTR